MAPHFYDDDEAITVSKEGPLVPKLIPSTEVTTETLTTGNQIYDSELISRRFSEARKAVARKLDIYNAELSTQKTAVANEIQSAKDYLKNNIFTDQYENKELLVPASILGLGAFFTGRVLSNSNNWGFNSPFSAQEGILSRKPTFTAKFMTSVPCRILLPWSLAGLAFAQLTPVTWHNGIECLERDLLPAEFVSSYHNLWNQIYVSGIKQTAQQWRQDLETTLQSNSRKMREFISKKLDE